MQFIYDIGPRIVAITAQFLGQHFPAWAVQLILMIVSVATIAVFVLITFMFLTYLERKIIARMQDRIGPNRVGPLGLLQPVADAIKMMTKEDITPTVAHRAAYNIAPVLVVAPPLMAFAVIPFGKGMIAADLNIGILYAVAISSLGTLGLLMAGWSSRNKFSLIGAMRAVAQMVSYEVPMILSLMGVLMITGSLAMGQIVSKQAVPFIILQPVAFIIYFISSIAELNRTPFDIPEAESEIVAGYHTEYSGMKFAMFMMSEYVSVIVMAAVGTTVFLGGWRGPVLPSYIWFLLKIYVIIFVLMWFRGTLPRLRVDQLQGFAWKFCVPVALLNIFMSGIVIFLVPPNTTHPLVQVAAYAVGNIILAIVVLLLYRRPTARAAAAVSGA
ncbi:MAG: NADH-quinone oxidoreductase subunit NuoH [Chloroflexi bacterium]|nr:NADH-quinone oxidoreductase subunit NuoH [Chloroflexota bacterium]